MVYEIRVTPTNNAGDITARVEQLKGIPAMVNLTPQGRVYKYVGIWLGTADFATPKNIKEGKIRFKVQKKWLRDNGFQPKDVNLERWDGASWQELATTIIEEDRNYTYYQASTRSFSPFAITAKKTTTIATPPPGEAQETPTPTPHPPGEKPPRRSGRTAILAVIVILVIAGIAGYYLYRRKGER